MAKSPNPIPKKTFIQNNLIFMGGSFAVAGLNYLFFPIIGRLVSVEQFGELQATLSIFSIVGVVLTAFGLAIARISQNSQKSEMVSRIYKLENLTILACFVSLVLSVIFRRIIEEYLGLTSFWPLALIAILVVINVPSTSRSYFLQSEEKYWAVNISALLFSSSKLLLSVVAAIIGFPVVGILIAFIVAQAFHLLYVTKQSAGDIPGLLTSVISQLRQTKNRLLDLLPKRTDVSTYMLSAIYLLFFTTLLTGDVIIARATLSAESAGIYSGISGISKIIYFATASIAGVLFVDSIKTNQDQNKLNRKIIFSYISVLMISLIISWIYSFKPELTIDLLIGNKYRGGATLILMFSIYMSAMAINGLVVNLMIAKQNLWGIIGPFGGLAVLYILQNELEHSQYSLVVSFTVGAVLSAAIMSIIIFIPMLKKRN